MARRASVAVVGVGHTPYGKLPEYDAYELGLWALKEALADDGVSVIRRGPSRCSLHRGRGGSGTAALVGSKGPIDTSEVGDAVCAVLKQMLSTAASSPAGVGLTVPSERPGQTKRLSMVYAEAKKENERPRSAHKDENLEWERRLQAMEAEGLARHEPLAL